VSTLFNTQKYAGSVHVPLFWLKYQPLIQVVHEVDNTPIQVSQLVAHDPHEYCEFKAYPAAQAAQLAAEVH
jgi:hypothetical protein